MSALLEKLIKYIKQLPQMLDVPRLEPKPRPIPERKWFREKGRTKIRFITKNAVISRKHYMKQATNFDTNFATRLLVDMTDINTGETFQRTMTVWHDDLMKRGEIENAFLEGWETLYPRYEIDSIMPVYGMESWDVYESRAAKLYK